VALPSFLKQHSITIKKAPDYTDTIETTGLVAPLTRSPFRDIILGGSADETMRLFVDDDVNISIRDQVIWNGKTYIVEGYPIKVPNPVNLTEFSHQECIIKEYEV